MATDDQYALLYNKKILPFDQMGAKFLDYIVAQLRNYGSDTFSTDAVLGSNPVNIVGGGSPNTINIGNGQSFSGVTGTGRKIKAGLSDSRLQNIKIPPVVTTFTVGIEANDVENGIEVNPRTGVFQYASMIESMGRVANPNSVTDNGDGTITLVVDSLFQAGDDHSGRSVRVWLKSVEKGGLGPQSASPSVAIQTVLSTFSGGSNKVTVVSKLGQSTVNTIVTNYMVQSVGPTVKRKSVEDLASTSGCLYLADVTGVTAGNIITSADQTRQNLVSIPLSDVDTRIVNLETGMNAFERSCIVSAVSTSFANSGNFGLNFPVAAGSAFVGGQVVTLAATTMVLPNNTGPFFVYIDSTTGALTTGFVVTLPSLMLYQVTTAGGNITSVIDMRRYATRNNSRDCVTVGTTNCDFTTMEGAIAWLAQNRSVTGEGIICEVVIQGIVTMTSQIALTFPVIIRGASMNGQVSTNPQLCTPPGIIAFTNGIASLDRVAFRDMIIQVGGTSPPSGSGFFLSNNSFTTLGDHWEFNNVTFTGALDQPFINIAGFSSNGPIGWRFNNCTFQNQSSHASATNAVFIGSGGSVGTPANGFSFRNCRFLGQTGNTLDQGIQFDNNVFDMLVENCEFNTGAIGVLLRNACDNIHIERCRFRNQRVQAISNATDGEVTIDACQFLNGNIANPSAGIIDIVSVSSHGGGLTVVRGCRFKNWTQGNAINITAGSEHRVENCVFTNTSANVNAVIIINATAVNYVTVIGCDFDQYKGAVAGNGRPGSTGPLCIQVGGVSIGWRVLNNKFKNNGSNASPAPAGTGAVLLGGGSNHMVANNTFQQCYGSIIVVTGDSIVCNNLDDNQSIDTNSTTKRIQATQAGTMIMGNVLTPSNASAIAIDVSSAGVGKTKIFANTTGQANVPTNLNWTGGCVRRRVSFDPPLTNVAAGTTVVVGTVAQPSASFGSHLPCNVNLPAALSTNTYQAGLRLTFSDGNIQEIFNATGSPVSTDLIGTNGVLTTATDNIACVRVDFLIKNTSGGVLNLDLPASLYEGWVIC